MKTIKKIVPTLLSNTEQPRVWSVRVQTKTYWSEMTFSHRAVADTEYRRLKTAGVFGGQWITELVIEEINDDATA